MDRDLVVSESLGPGLGYLRSRLARDLRDGPRGLGDRKIRDVWGIGMELGAVGRAKGNGTEGHVVDLGDVEVIIWPIFERRP